MPALDLEIAALPSSRLPITRIDYRLDGGTALELPGGTAAGTRKLLLASTASVAVQVRAVAGGRAGPWSVAKTAVPYDAPSGPAPEPQPEPGPEPLPQAATVYVDPSRATSGNGLTPATALKALPAGPFTAGTTIKVRGGTRLPGNIDLQSGGTRAQPIVLDLNHAGDWGTGPAVLTGEEPVVTAWAQSTLNGVSVWTTTRPQSDSAVIYQGDFGRFWPCQYPAPTVLAQNGSFQAAGQFFAVPMSVVTGSTIAVPAGPIRDWLDAAHAVEPLQTRASAVLWGAMNLRASRAIQSYVDGLLTFESFTPISGKTTFYFGISNHPSALLVPGQYLTTAETVTIRPYEDANPNSAGITYPATRAWGIRLGASHIHVKGGIIRRMRTVGAVGTGTQTGRYSSAVLLPHIASGRTGARIVGTVIEDMANQSGNNTTPASIRVENWKDVLIEGVTITDSGGYGIAMYNCTNSYALGCNIERSSTTCMTMRFNEGCGFVGNTMKDPSNVHGNAMSLYEGNTDCLILFNTCRITNAESSSPGMVAHGLKGCTVAFNTARNASDGVTMQQHVPGGAYKPGYGTGLGDGSSNIWANNVALNAGKVAFNIRDNGNPGSTVVNNIVDTLAYDKMPIGDGWVNVEATYDTASSEERAAYLRPVNRRRNVWTRTYALGSTYPIQSAQRSALEEPVRTGTARSALFADLANDDLRPADPLLREGHAWSFSYGTFSTVIDWIGRYRPDGTEAFDWRSVNWGNLK